MKHQNHNNQSYEQKKHQPHGKNLAAEFEKVVDNVVDQPVVNEISEAFAFLSPVQEYGQRAIRFTADYSRLHPIRMAITASILGYFAIKAFRPRASNIG